MDNKPTVKEYLASLGTTPDEIANSLRKQGIKGKMRCSYHCIIANAVNKKCRGWGGLTIQGGVHHGYWATWNDAQIMDPRLPPVVVEFIRKFDLGEYPDLVG